MDVDATDEVDSAGVVVAAEEDLLELVWLYEGLLLEDADRVVEVVLNVVDDAFEEVCALLVLNFPVDVEDSFVVVPVSLDDALAKVLVLRTLVVEAEDFAVVGADVVDLLVVKTDAELVVFEMEALVAGCVL